MPRYLSISLPPPEADAPPRDLKAAARWASRYTPLSASDAPDGLMLDIAGAAHLFGGEAAMMQQVENDFARWRMGVRCAIAPTPEAARALARFGEAHAARRLIPDDTNQHSATQHNEGPAERRARLIARYVSHLPVTALRLASDVTLALGQSGLKRIGDIWLRPRAPLTARFGAELFATLDAMMGLSKSAISPVFEAPAYVAERRFAHGIIAREAIEATVAALMQDIAQMLERHGEGARQLTAVLFRTDGKTTLISCATSRPQRDPRVMARLFHEKFDAASDGGKRDPFDAGYGFDVIRLAVMAAEPLAAQQVSLHASANAGNLFQESWRDEQQNAALKDFLDRMSARFGASRVQSFVPGDTHIPEHAALRVNANDTSRDERHRAKPDAPAPHDDFTRPVRLFERPEPVETLAMVPDGPPLRFRWRRVLHEVAAYEGPERIAPQWWRGQEDALTRDYFRVENTHGQRFWLYREGLYTRETARPRWFMHGLFG